MSRNFVAPQQDKLQANLLSEHTLKNKLQKNSVTEAYVLTILKHSVNRLRFLFLPLHVSSNSEKDVFFIPES